jgi:hypothetical protein
MAAAVGASMAWVFWPRQDDLGSGMDMVECGDDLGTFYRPRGGERRRSGGETVGGGEWKFIVFNALVTQRGTEGATPGLGGEEAARATLDLVRRWWSEGVAAHGCGRWRRRFRLPLAGGGR